MSANVVNKGDAFIVIVKEGQGNREEGEGYKIKESKNSDKRRDFKGCYIKKDIIHRLRRI